MAGSALSVSIIARNESANIADALKSVEGWSAEIVVVDAMSTDDTVAICKRFGARVIQEPWKGYSAQKNFALDQCSNDWVLSLDADERVTPELKAEVVALLARGPELAGYFVPRKNWFLGRWIRHGGWYPDSSIRLFDRRRGRFGDREVHETVTLAGSAPAGRLQNAMLHYTYNDLASYLERQNRYSTLAARELFQKGRRFRWSDALIRPAVSFVRTYLLQAGFLDGWRGFVISKGGASYTLAKYLKLRELNRQAPDRRL